ncbi:hypothetical protein QTP86_000064 [Hemibagrus guttatus]|nr:hypothetical protein QTP86_000064 [Hemibagrus guttatus]
MVNRKADSSSVQTSQALNSKSMSERTALGATMETMTLEEPGVEEASPRVPGPLRCGPCAMWPRQQTWLCAVPLLMGFVGLGLSLMLLKWIVVGSVQDYVPTDLVNAKGIGQDPIFLSKPSALPKGPDAATTSTTSPGNTNGPIPGSAADGTSTVRRTQSDTSSNHSSNSSGARGAGTVEGGSVNRAPHLHNRVGTRGNGTAIPGEKESCTTKPNLHHYHNYCNYHYFYSKKHSHYPSAPTYHYIYSAYPALKPWTSQGAFHQAHSSSPPLQNTAGSIFIKTARAFSSPRAMSGSYSPLHFIIELMEDGLALDKSLSSMECQWQKAAISEAYVWAALCSL